MSCLRFICACVWVYRLPPLLPKYVFHRVRLWAEGLTLPRKAMRKHHSHWPPRPPLATRRTFTLHTRRSEPLSGTHLTILFSEIGPLLANGRPAMLSSYQLSSSDWPTAASTLGWIYSKPASQCDQLLLVMCVRLQLAPWHWERRDGFVIVWNVGLKPKSELFPERDDLRRGVVTDLTRSRHFSKWYEEKRCHHRAKECY